MSVSTRRTMFARWSPIVGRGHTPPHRSGPDQVGVQVNDCLGETRAARKEGLDVASVVSPRPPPQLPHPPRILFPTVLLPDPQTHTWGDRDGRPGLLSTQLRWDWPFIGSTPSNGGRSYVIPAKALGDRCRSSRCVVVRDGIACRAKVCIRAPSYGHELSD